MFHRFLPFLLLHDGTASAAVARQEETVFRETVGMADWAQKLKGGFKAMPPDDAILPDALVAQIGLVEGSLLHFGFICMCMGLCLFLGLFAFVQSVYNRDSTYRHWAFYLWSNCMLFFTALDYNFKLGLLSATRPLTSIAQYFIQIAYLLFISSFLEIKRYHPATHRLIRMLIGLITLGLVYVWYATQNLRRIYIDFGDGFIFITDLLILALFIRIVKSGIPQTRLLIIGSLGVLTMAVLAGIIDIFNLNQDRRWQVDPIVCFSVGVIFELVFFSLALSQRTRLIQMENNRLQQDYTRKLEEELASRVATIQTQNRLIEEEQLRRLTNNFNQKIAETEMAALRSQMNPHFIFNCLNSIQYFTARNDIETASDYLTKFSRLIRLVLENSKSEKVTLENELETLRLYIEMEAMRFRQKVRYDIQIDPEIDIESVQIPPLLLQPFVENAIWHGLMHKDEGGTVQVLIQQPQNRLLHIEITDDGVGRQQAAEFKSKSATRHKSFGMKLTADRIALINQLYQIQTQIDVLDLVDEQGNAKGTKVIIEIPV